MSQTVAGHLMRDVDSLWEAVRRDAEVRMAVWKPHLHRRHFLPSAANLAAYLALRQHDLRPLQRRLMAWGMSSLGRIESRVEPGLQALRASLAAAAGQPDLPRPTESEFFAGEARLRHRARELLGTRSRGRPVALLVTCPSEAADSPQFMQSMAELRVEGLRINCAHDDARRWQRMVDYAKTASNATGHRMRIFMDLAGPKIRTAAVQQAGDGRLREGNELSIFAEGALKTLRSPVFAAECTLSEPLAAARPGERVFYDDGKLAATVIKASPSGLLLRVDRCPSKGVKLKPEKGLNFPDTHFEVDALTPKDLRDLDFALHHADGIGYSFVQTTDDMHRLQQAMAERSSDWHRLALVLKIETPRAVRNLPDVLVHAAGRQLTAVMIARGDLAVEIGFSRMAEMQEEILWLCEAAQVPVIWATQVLEQLVKKGTPVRGEMTDAAMAARAECVMLNKGPHLTQAIQTLDTLLVRMDEHQRKKTPMLRPLQSWQ